MNKARSLLCFKYKGLYGLKNTDFIVFSTGVDPERLSTAPHCFYYG